MTGTGGAGAEGSSIGHTATGYSGHGAESVSAEVLKRYAPPPVPSELSRRVQAMMDLRPPGHGLVTGDGKRMFFSWAVTGTTQVWRLDAPQRFPVQMTGGEDSTHAAAVSPDGSFIVVSRDRKGEENPGLYIQSASGGPLTLIQDKPGIQTHPEFVTDDSRYIYFRSNDVKPDSYAIYRFDRTKQQRETILDRPGLWAISDHRPDGRLLLQKSIGSRQSEIYEYQPASGALTPLFGQGEKEWYHARYGAAKGEVLVLTPKFSEFQRLYRWSGKEFTPITPEINYDVSTFHIDRQRQRILYNVNQEGYSRVHALNARTYQEIKLPDFPSADGVMSTATTSNGRFTTFSVLTSSAPSTSYVYDWKTQSLVQWQISSTPEVDTGRFAMPKLERFPARDGTSIPMWVRRPKSCAEPCPVIVHFHGGPEAQALPGFSTRAQLFVDEGFVYVEPNVRGSAGYGKTWFHADDGPKRLKVITDIEDCASFIRANWTKDGKAPRIGVFGGSYGGYATQIAMTMFAGAYDAGVSVVGISNLLTFLQNTAPYRRTMRSTEYGDPEKDREALIQLSPMTYLDRVKGPILLIQGASDPRVPVGEAVQFHEALQARHLPSELIIFANEGHGMKRRDNTALELGHALRFFRDHLQGSGKPLAAGPGANEKGN